MDKLELGDISPYYEQNLNIHLALIEKSFNELVDEVEKLKEENNVLHQKHLLLMEAFVETMKSNHYDQ